jgi:FkbM family methyltransferase
MTMSHKVKKNGHYGPVDIVKRIKDTVGTSAGVVLDVGTNIGVVSLYAAKLGFSVTSVEASELNMKRLQESLGMNNFHGVTALKIAVSDKPACMPMAIGWHKSGNNINLGSNSFAVKAGDHDVEYVLAAPLQTLVAPDVKVAFFKLDVEGCWECFALDGAVELFARKQVQHIFTEVNHDMLLKAGCSPDGLKSRLDKLCIDVSGFPDAKAGTNPDFFGKSKPMCEVTLWYFPSSTGNTSFWFACTLLVLNS